MHEQDLRNIVVAKKAMSGAPNKSLEIRNYKEANPTASPKEIAETLGRGGIDVTPQFVSTVLSNANRKGGKVGKRGRKPGPATMGSTGNIQQLLHAKKLVEQMGGIEEAKAAINALAQILA